MGEEGRHTGCPVSNFMMACMYVRTVLSIRLSQYPIPMILSLQDHDLKVKLNLTTGLRRGEQSPSERLKSPYTRARLGGSLGGQTEIPQGVVAEGLAQAVTSTGKRDLSSWRQGAELITRE